jgi:hypothetical protein
VRECKFRVMVELDPSARADAVRRLLDGTGPQCVLQPCDGKWFPAAVSVGGSPLQGQPVDAVVCIRLLAGESEAFFATGQPLTLWADAIVDDQTVRGEGRMGDGFIVCQESAADEAARAAARPALTYRRTVPRPRRGTGASLMAGRQ